MAPSPPPSEHRHDAADGMWGGDARGTLPGAGLSGRPGRGRLPEAAPVAGGRIGLALALGAGLAAQPALIQPALAQSAPGPSATVPRDPFEGVPPGPLMRDDVAGARQISGYVAKGIDVGGLHVQPSVTLRGDASSNLFSRAGGRGDVWATLAPAVLATGGSGPARYVIDARAGLARYARLTGYAAETWSLRAQVAVPVGNRLTLAASAAQARRMEPPQEAAGATGVDGGAVLVDQVRVSLGARAELGLTRLIAGFDLGRSHYLPLVSSAGAVVSQGFRDDRVISLSLRAEHSLGGGHLVFVEGTQRWIRSPHPGAAADRSGHAGEALVGMRGGLGPLVMADLAVGQQWRSYRSPGLKDWRALTWRARVEWYATPLVTFSLASRRDTVNSPLPGAAGVVVDQVTAGAHYEVRRNLVLVLSASHAVERYRHLAGPAAPAPSIRSDSFGIEAVHSANRHVQIGLSARTRDRRSGSPFLPRQGHAVEGGLWLRFSV